MLGACLVLGALGALAVSAGLVATCLRPASLTHFLLTAYIVAWAHVVVVTVVVSLLDRFTSTAMVIGVAGLLVASIGLWERCGRPRTPDIGSRLRWLRATLRDPLLFVPAAALAGAYTYLVSLGIGTPQNDADALVYHLTRAALWSQNHALGWLGAESEPRLDGNPVVAEIAQATTMTLAGSERFVWVGQGAATLALALGTFALARRLGRPPREALFGALLVPLLPIVVVQSFTAYNDLVVASFVLAAAVFALADRRADLPLVAAAVALAVGTKLSAPLVLPVVALLALVARPRRSWAGLAAAGAVGAIVGAGWYVVNLVQTGELDGGLAEAGGQEAVRTVPVVVFNLQSQILDALELPGARGSGAWLYPIAGVVLAAVLLWRRHAPVRAVAAAALVAVLPALVVGLGEGLAWTFARTWETRGEDAFAMQFDRWEPSRWADGLATSFGPTLVGLVLGSLGAVLVLRRTRSLPPAAVVAASAPLLGLAMVVVSIPDDPWRSRFLVAAVAMSAALWGLALRVRWLAASVVAAAVASLALVLVNLDGKPSGISLLGGNASPAVWGLERWRAQTLLRTLPFTVPENATIRWVEEHVPQDESLALDVRYNDLTFPYVGSTLDRPLTLVAADDPVPVLARWLVSAPERTPRGCRDAWQVAFEAGEGWLVRKRVQPDRCSTPTQLAG